MALRGSHARYQQWHLHHKISILCVWCGGAQLLDPVSLQLQVFKKSTSVYEYIFPCSREQDENIGGGGICVFVFVNLCAWPYVFAHIHISIALCMWFYMCLLGICAQLYMFIGWAWEYGAAAALSLLVYRPWYTPAKLWKSRCNSRAPGFCFL